MWRKLSCLLLCIAMLAGLAGCGQAASDTGRSEGKTVDKVTSTDNAAAADTAAQNKAYGAALWDIYLYGILPDNSKLDYSSTQQAEENTFAIYDVDHDGREELIVQWSAHAAMASKMCLIYGYDNGKLHEELSEFVDMRFYSNGAVEASGRTIRGWAAASGRTTSTPTTPRPTATVTSAPWTAGTRVI